MQVAPDKPADTSVAIDPVLAARWSPLAFDPERLVSQEDSRALLEAARWAPSIANTQPWSFVLVVLGTPEHAAVVDTLLGATRAWAQHAPLLIVAAATEPSEQHAPWTAYDLGQSAAYLTVEASARGLYVHQLAAFDAAVLGQRLGVPAQTRLYTVLAIGHRRAADLITPEQAAKELAPRTRRPLRELAHLGFWGRPFT
jgi:nitroreductase